MSEYNHGWWHSSDGLRLHYRDYPGTGQAGRPPVLCLHGLTRNARDFEGLAAWLASAEGGGWRVICPEMRGRGLSAYAPDATTYTPAHYVGDVLALLDEGKIARAVVVGTSMGGIMAMVLGLVAPGRLAGVVLNDIGPVIEAAGLAKIGSYVGSDPRFADWQAGAEALRATFATTYPGWDEADWLAMARRVMVAGDGAVRFDYDPRIAEPFAAPPPAPAPSPTPSPAPTPDMWSGLEALGPETSGTPLLLVRGGLSDILSDETLAEMVRRAPGARALTLADVGHAPTLDELEAMAAITALLEEVR